MLQKRIDDQPSLSRQMVREAEDILHRHLKGVGLKQTAQRDTILRTFLETRDHLSTDELHRLVQKKDAHIGYTTVYRTLKLLAECGLASEVAFHDGIRATSTNTIAAAIITWCARIVAVRLNSSRLRWTSLSRRSGANTTT